jgi:predicted nucleic acid-binding Zn ribbon protein
MAKKKKNQRRVNTQQLIFAIIGLIIILSMVVSLFMNI